MHEGVYPYQDALANKDPRQRETAGDREWIPGQPAEEKFGRYQPSPTQMPSDPRPSLAPQVLERARRPVERARRPVEERLYAEVQQPEWTSEDQQLTIPLTPEHAATIVVPRPLELRHVRAIRRWADFMADALEKMAEDIPGQPLA